MTLFTNRYKDFRREQGIPVRITYGAPRYRLQYPLNFQAKLLTPGSWFLKGTDEEFTRRYYDMLDHNGLDAITEEFNRIIEKTGESNLVLLCFDDVRKGLCHRTLFAKWFEARTGQKVRELQEGFDNGEREHENVLF